MSRELFQELRALLMERLDLARELSDEEILGSAIFLLGGKVEDVYKFSIGEAQRAFISLTKGIPMCFLAIMS